MVWIRSEIGAQYKYRLLRAKGELCVAPPAGPVHLVPLGLLGHALPIVGDDDVLHAGLGEGVGHSPIGGG